MRCPTRESLSARKRDEDAITPLEIIIATAFLCIVIYLFAGAVCSTEKDVIGGSSGGIFGVLQSSTTNMLLVDGTCYGLQDINGSMFGVDLVTYDTETGVLGSASIPIRLAALDVSTIDFSGVVVSFTYNGKTEILKYSEKRPLISPSWTIATKSMTIPLLSADNDLILEANELFTIIAYPSANVPAYQKFTVTFGTNNGDPLIVNLEVPKEITSHQTVPLIK